MKKVTQSLAVFAAILALTASAFAADCCEKSVAAAKKGKLCEKCAKDACCKDAITQAAKDGATKPCKVCAAKEKKS